MVKPSRLLTCSMTWTSELPSPTYTVRSGVICQAPLDALEHLDLAVSGRHLPDRPDFSRHLVVVELGAEDVIRRDDAFERGLDDLARSGGNDVKGEPEALDAVREEIDELRNVVFQTDAAAGLDQVFAPDAAKLRIVPDQIGELSALVDEITAPQSFDFGVERGTPSRSPSTMPESLKLRV